MSPKKMVELKYVTARFLEYPLDLRENGKGQIQQVGFDVRVHSISKILGTGYLMVNEKRLPSYAPLMTNQDNAFVLQPGAYAVECMEDTEIPPDHEGRVLHRSTVNRCGCTFTGSVYDPGYKGVIAGTLYVHNPFVIQFGARIGQFEITPKEQASLYDGDYQNQASHSKAAEKVNERKT
jgi:deoxycytidine triphosphate deaminase